MHPASILAYGGPNSAVSAVVRDLGGQAALNLAPYKITSVESPERFSDELKTELFDVVLIDASDLNALGEQARLAPYKPVLLPVVSKSNKAETVAAGKQFRRVLKAPSSASQYLETIDDALEARSKTGSPKK
jgi:DNA-binding NtrC family response regulator